MIPKINKLLYRLPYTISIEDQQKLVNYGYKYASWDNSFGRVQMRRPTAESLSVISNYKDLTAHDIARLYRMHPHIQWEWIENPVTEIIQKIMDPIDHLFQKLTRLILLVQTLDGSISSHTDTPGGLNSNTDAYMISLQKDMNHNMALKWPITATSGNNGLPFLEIDGKKYGYDVENNLFAINEHDIMHGANKSGIRRGVLFLDGILNYENLLKETRLPVRIFRV